jgi:hypothetical protein
MHGFVLNVVPLRKQYDITCIISLRNSHVWIDVLPCNLAGVRGVLGLPDGVSPTALASLYPLIPCVIRDFLIENAGLYMTNLLFYNLTGVGGVLGWRSMV